MVARAAGSGPATWALGGLFERLVAGAETGGLLGASLVTQPAGIAPPLHVHTREAEAWYLLEGTLTYQAGDERVDLEPGGFIYLPRGCRTRSAPPQRRPLPRADPAGRRDGPVRRGGHARARAAAARRRRHRRGVARWLAAAPRYGLQVVGPPIPARNGWDAHDGPVHDDSGFVLPRVARFVRERLTPALHRASVAGPGRGVDGAGRAGAVRRGRRAGVPPVRRRRGVGTAVGHGVVPRHRRGARGVGAPGAGRSTSGSPARAPASRPRARCTRPTGWCSAAWSPAPRGAAGPGLQQVHGRLRGRPLRRGRRQPRHDRRLGVGAHPARRPRHRGRRPALPPAARSSSPTLDIDGVGAAAGHLDVDRAGRGAARRPPPPRRGAAGPGARGRRRRPRRRRRPPPRPAAPSSPTCSAGPPTPAPTACTPSATRTSTRRGCGRCARPSARSPARSPTRCS